MKNNKKFSKSLLFKKLSLAEKFHNKTKLRKFPINDDPKFWPESWNKIYYKGYLRLEEIELPKPMLPGTSFKKTLYLRNSCRIFSSVPLSLYQLSSILYYSAGLKFYKSAYLAQKFYPSAGRRYPLETYFISLNTELPKGLYHYYIKTHKLEKLLRIDKFDKSRYFGQEWIDKAGCILIITAIFKRNTVKYGDRGYRHIMVEAGHLSQNIYLISPLLNIGCCAIGGYIDDNLHRLLDIDGISEAVVYVLALGNK